MTHRDGVAELACETVGSVNNLAVDHDAASDTCAEGNHYEVFHALGNTVCHLTHGCRIGIVGKGYGDAAAGFGKLLGELHLAVCGPGKIGCEGYASGVIVAVWRANTDTADLAVFAGFGHQFDNRLGEFLDDYICISAGIGHYHALGENLAACIDYAELAALAANVYSYNKILIHISLPGYLC